MTSGDGTCRAGKGSALSEAWGPCRHRWIGGSPPLCAYSPALRCPLSTQHMLLEGSGPGPDRAYGATGLCYAGTDREYGVRSFGIARVRGVRAGAEAACCCQVNPNAFIAWDGHDAAVLSVAVVRGQLCSADMHGEIMVWALPALARAAHLLQHRGEVWALAGEETQGLLISAGEDWGVCVWDAAAWTLLRTLHAHSAPVRSLAVAGHVLFSGSTDCSLRSWNLVSGLEIGSPMVHTGWVMSLDADAPRGKVLAACSDGSVYRWDVETGVLEAEQPRHSDWVTAVRVVRVPEEQGEGEGEEGASKVWVASGSVDKDIVVGPVVGQPDAD